MTRRRARVEASIWTRNAVAIDGVELAVDGSCEAAGTGAWTKSALATISKVAEPRPNSAGTQSFKIEYGGANSYAFQNIMTIGRMYRARGWIRGNKSTPGYGISSTTNPGAAGLIYQITTSWTYFDVYFFPHSSTFYIFASGTAVGDWTELDDFSVVEVCASDVLGLSSTANSRVCGALSDNLGAVFCANKARGSSVGVRVHPAATQLLPYSNFAQVATLVALSRTNYFERGANRLLETAVNSAHSISKPTAATVANSTTYTLSLRARYVSSARTLRVTITFLDGTTTQAVFTLTATNALYSHTFTTGWTAAGACVILLEVGNAGSYSYAGTVTEGIVLGEVIQLETGDIATPSMHTHGATVSSVAPKYNATGINSYIYDRLASPFFAFEERLTFFAQYPDWADIWAIDWAGNAACVLSYEQGCGFYINGEVLSDTHMDAWFPEADHVYRFRCQINSAGDGYLRVVDETDDQVDLDIDIAIRTWTAPSSPATAVLLGCDAAGASQWNHIIQEATAE